MRVSVDHYTRALHEHERGPRSWKPTIDGMRWLAETASRHVAGRLFSGEAEDDVRAGYARLFARRASDRCPRSRSSWCCFRRWMRASMCPEITEACWGILGKVAGGRDVRVVPHGGEAQGRRRACRARLHAAPLRRAVRTGRDTGRSVRPVALNHPHCAKFCVLGGAACSANVPPSPALAGSDRDEAIQPSQPPLAASGLLHTQ